MQGVHTSKTLLAGPGHGWQSEIFTSASLGSFVMLCVIFDVISIVSGMSIVNVTDVIMP